jgi:hypothetical protein
MIVLTMGTVTTPLASVSLDSWVRTVLSRPVPMIVPIVVFVLTGLVSVILATQVLIAPSLSALSAATGMAIAQAVCVIVVLVGLVMLVRFPLAPHIVIIMVSVLMVSVTAVPGSPVRTAPFALAQLSATTMVYVLTTLAIAMRVSLVLTVL